MSANNFRTCPACLAEHQQLKSELESELQAAYGKEPESQYQNRLKQIFALPKVGEYFREDWEIYTVSDSEKSILYVGYYGRCQQCKASVSFKREIEIQIAKGQDVEL